jgi:hypothetical protein
MESVKQFVDQNKKSSFSDLLLILMRERKIDAPTLYKRAYLDRKLFSKILSDPTYKPSKPIVCALALGLHLDAKTSKQFIKRAGYILTSGSLFDLGIRYCIEHQIYDILKAEATLQQLNVTMFKLRHTKD